METDRDAHVPTLGSAPPTCPPTLNPFLRLEPPSIRLDRSRVLLYSAHPVHYPDNGIAHDSWRLRPLDQVAALAHAHPVIPHNERPISHQHLPQLAMVDADVSLFRSDPFIVVLVHIRDACCEPIQSDPSEMRAILSQHLHDSAAASTTHSQPRMLQVLQSFNLSLIASLPSPPFASALDVDPSKIIHNPHFYETFLLKHERVQIFDSLNRLSLSQRKQTTSKAHSPKMLILAYSMRVNPLARVDKRAVKGPVSTSTSPATEHEQQFKHQSHDQYQQQDKCNSSHAANTNTTSCPPSPLISVRSQIVAFHSLIFAFTALDQSNNPPSSRVPLKSTQSSQQPQTTQPYHYHQRQQQPQQTQLARTPTLVTVPALSSPCAPTTTPIASISNGTRSAIVSSIGSLEGRCNLDCSPGDYQQQLRRPHDHHPHRHQQQSQLYRHHMPHSYLETHTSSQAQPPASQISSPVTTGALSIIGSPNPNISASPIHSSTPPQHAIHTRRSEANFIQKQAATSSRLSRQAPQLALSSSPHADTHPPAIAAMSDPALPSSDPTESRQQHEFQKQQVWRYGNLPTVYETGSDQHDQPVPVTASYSPQDIYPPSTLPYGTPDRPPNRPSPDQHMYSHYTFSPQHHHHHQMPHELPYQQHMLPLIVNSPNPQIMHEYYPVHQQDQQRIYPYHYSHPQPYDFRIHQQTHLSLSPPMKPATPALGSSPPHAAGPATDAVDWSMQSADPPGPSRSHKGKAPQSQERKLSMLSSLSSLSLSYPMSLVSSPAAIHPLPVSSHKSSDYPDSHPPPPPHPPMHMPMHQKLHPASGALGMRQSPPDMQLHYHMQVPDPQLLNAMPAHPVTASASSHYMGDSPSTAFKQIPSPQPPHPPAVAPLSRVIMSSPSTAVPQPDRVVHMQAAPPVDPTSLHASTSAGSQFSVHEHDALPEQTISHYPYPQRGYYDPRLHAPSDYGPPRYHTDAPYGGQYYPPPPPPSLNPGLPQSYSYTMAPSSVLLHPPHHHSSTESPASSSIPIQQHDPQSVMGVPPHVHIHPSTTLPSTRFMRIVSLHPQQHQHHPLSHAPIHQYQVHPYTQQPLSLPSSPFQSQQSPIPPPPLVSRHSAPQQQPRVTTSTQVTVLPQPSSSSGSKRRFSMGDVIPSHPPGSAFVKRAKHSRRGSRGNHGGSQVARDPGLDHGEGGDQGVGVGIDVYGGHRILVPTVDPASGGGSSVGGNISGSVGGSASASASSGAVASANSGAGGSDFSRANPGNVVFNIRDGGDIIDSGDPSPQMPPLQSPVSSRLKHSREASVSAQHPQSVVDPPMGDNPRYHAPQASIHVHVQHPSPPPVASYPHHALHAVSTATTQSSSLLVSLPSLSSMGVTSMSSIPHLIGALGSSTLSVSTVSVSPGNVKEIATTSAFDATVTTSVLPSTTTMSTASMIHHPSMHRQCENCGISESPEWRRGPNGHKTLCNACGLRYARVLSKRREAVSMGAVTNPVAFASMVKKPVMLKQDAASHLVTTEAMMGDAAAVTPKMVPGRTFPPTTTTVKDVKESRPSPVAQPESIPLPRPMPMEPPRHNPTHLPYMHRSYALSPTLPHLHLTLTPPISTPVLPPISLIASPSQHEINPFAISSTPVPAMALHTATTTPPSVSTSPIPSRAVFLTPLSNVLVTTMPSSAPSSTSVSMPSQSSSYSSVSLLSSDLLLTHDIEPS